MAESSNGADSGTSWETAAADHKSVYSGFLGLTKWAIILIALVLVLMAIFLT